MLRDSSRKKGTKKNAASRAIPNVLKSPWNITDGTFLGIKDVSIEGLTQEDDFAAATHLPHSKAMNSAPAGLMRKREVTLSIR